MGLLRKRDQNSKFKGTCDKLVAMVEIRCKHLTTSIRKKANMESMLNCRTLKTSLWT